MNNHTKSSITLPPNELKDVEALMKKLKVKTKVEVVRQGLLLLKERLNRDALREAYSVASEKTKAQALELDSLSEEGIE